MTGDHVAGGIIIDNTLVEKAKPTPSQQPAQAVVFVPSTQQATATSYVYSQVYATSSVNRHKPSDLVYAEDCQ